MGRDDGASGVGGRSALLTDLTVESHGESQAENQQDGDPEGDSQHYHHILLHQVDDSGGAGRAVVTL